jgi:hypothetical protein
MKTQSKGSKDDKGRMASSAMPTLVQVSRPIYVISIGVKREHDT